jgi:DNA-binding transcriptional ArsR family regulator
MKKYQATYHWKLTEQQIILLIYIHKFRFITSDIVAEILGKDRSTIYERLSVLVDQDYITKQYDSTYRLRRRPASYCLAPKGIRALTGDKRVEQTSLRQQYKNKTQTEEQIDQCLEIANIYLAIHRHYPGRFAIYTKYQLDRKYLISPAPALKLEDDRDDAPDFYLDIIPAMHPSWLLKKRIRQHEQRAERIDAVTDRLEEEGIEEGDYYPHVLFVAGNNATERRLVRFTNERYNDFKYFTTTIGRLLGENGNGRVGLEATSDPTIWADPDSDDCLDLERYKGMEGVERVGLGGEL